MPHGASARVADPAAVKAARGHLIDLDEADRLAE